MNKIKTSFSHGNSVARIILDDGKGNVIDKIMIGELSAVLNSFQGNRELKLITFEGTGKHFSFGASVEEHRKELVSEMLPSFHSIFYTISQLSVPTLAKISGQCLGGGLELALICNFLFADKSARLGQPEIVLGVFPPPASILLPLKIGNARAEDILLTGKVITAEDAMAAGLLNEIFDDKATLDSGTDEWIIKNILPKSASSLKYGVNASRIFFNHILGKFLPALEETYLNNLMNTHDANEGITAFLEKRKPEWKNR
ncbi:MAG: enoyl-CoA hydratase/isomerase family protein [Bacteroidetes bacterium]|nr:enoyl-CoA hydratase/isomerase family protein [Bacteroidota bacterium]